MLTMDWLDTHLGSIDETVKTINQFSWNISVIENEEKWYVLTGDKEKAVIFSADSRDVVDAFLYGMGLSYIGIPSPLFENLAKDVETWSNSQ